MADDDSFDDEPIDSSFSQNHKYGSYLVKTKGGI